MGLAGVAAVTALAYADSFGGALVFDSRALILENPVVHQASLANVRFILTHDYWQPMSTDGLYRPLTVLSYLFNYAVLRGGGAPAGYHAVNLVLHLACVGLVYALLWHLTRRAWPAVLAAAVFGLHPVATEAVTNVVGRADLLAAIGVMGGLLCHVRATESAGPLRAVWRAALALSAVVAFFSKESGLVLVPILLAHDLVFRRAVRGSTGAVVPAIGVLAVYLGARWYVAHTGLPAEDIAAVDNPIVEAGFWTGRLTAVKVLGHDALLLLFPASLSADYSYREVPVVAWPPHGLGDLGAIVALVALGALGWALARERARDRPLFFLGLFSLLALLPATNLVLVIGSIMAERFLYLPLAGFAGALALIAERVARRQEAQQVSGAIALVLLLCAGRTVVRNRDWNDEIALWSSAVQASPDSAKAHKAYAAAVFAADPDRRRIDEVIAEGERAVEIRPDYLGALVDLGSYYVARGDLAGAPHGRPWYERGVAVLERARLLETGASQRFIEKMLARGTPPEAIPDFANTELYANLPLAYARAGRLEDALAAYEEARRLDPGKSAPYLDISAVLALLGRWEDASITLFEAVTVDPDDHEAAMRLVGMYRHFYAQGHAIVDDSADHVTVNLDDPVVHRHRCKAYLGLAEIYRRARLPDRAAHALGLATGFCIEEDTTPAGRDDPRA